MTMERSSVWDSSCVSTFESNITSKNIIFWRMYSMLNYRKANLVIEKGCDSASALKSNKNYSFAIIFSEKGDVNDTNMIILLY